MTTRETQQNSTHAVASPIAARKKLESDSTLHWFHWLIVSMSFVLTFFAWYFTKSELEARVKVQFDREADQVIELVQERLRKYEDALWGGVALIDTSGGDVEFDRWKRYADSLHIETKYPGINGIGVIHAMSEEKLVDYLAEQRKRRPDYGVHPPHAGNEYYPISYIIPVEGNENAVGLDMAHESNRFTAAKKSRDTGEAQITGPITLVQDSGKTPGFLFYAPFFQGGATANMNDRRERFSGMVYAPFVVKKLMEGVLEKEKRHVGIRLVDGVDVLYDELVSGEANFDADPIHKRVVDVDFYGRTWAFDIWSAQSFRQASADSQPLMILVGGIFIDSLLIFLFISISRASHRALGYADSMTHRLERSAEALQTNQSHLAERATELKKSNAELEQFAYVASHDLKEPLRMVSNYTQLLAEDYAGQLDEDAIKYINYATDGAVRMQILIDDLLEYSRVGKTNSPLTSIDLQDVVSHVVSDLEVSIERTSASIEIGPLPSVVSNGTWMTQLFQNLIGNALKFRSDEPPFVHISSQSLGKEWQFTVEDNGIGIEPAYRERIFGIFQRLHTRDKYEGTGIGLAVCQKIVEHHGGRIWVESELGEGTAVHFVLPVETISHFKTDVVCTDAICS
jgi:signal transduction histidine kinase